MDLNLLCIVFTLHSKQGKLIFWTWIIRLTLPFFLLVTILGFLFCSSRTWNFRTKEPIFIFGMVYEEHVGYTFSMHTNYHWCLVLIFWEEPVFKFEFLIFWPKSYDSLLQHCSKFYQVPNFRNFIKFYKKDKTCLEHIWVSQVVRNVTYSIINYL